MNLIILHEEDFITPDTVRISGRRFEHIVSVLKAREGDTVKTGLLNGNTGAGEIISLAAGSADIRVDLDCEPPLPIPLSLVIALPRPKILRRVIQCATVMGVKKIALIRTWKVEKSYWQSPFTCDESLAGEMELGLEQAGDTVLPVVKKYPLFRPFIEDELEAFAAGTDRILSHPGAAESCPVDIRRPATLAIGPEAGFTPYEIGMFEKAGFRTVGIGKRILRVDQAVPALISRLFPG